MRWHVFISHLKWTAQFYSMELITNLHWLKCIPLCVFCMWDLKSNESFQCIWQVIWHKGRVWLNKRKAVQACDVKISSQLKKTWNYCNKPHWWEYNGAKCVIRLCWNVLEHSATKLSGRVRRGEDTQKKMITISQDDLAYLWVTVVKQIKEADRSYSTLNPFEAFLLCLFQRSHLLNLGNDTNISVWKHILYLFQNLENLVDLLKHIYPKHGAEASDIHMHSECFILKCTELYQYNIWSHNHPFWFQDFVLTLSSWPYYFWVWASKAIGELEALIFQTNLK